MAADCVISNVASSGYLISTWIEKGSMYGKERVAKTGTSHSVIFWLEESNLTWMKRNLSFIYLMVITVMESLFLLAPEECNGLLVKDDELAV
jgi:hypothetical protein